MKEGTLAPSDMNNIFSMFKTQGHDEVNTKPRKLFSYSDMT